MALLSLEAIRDGIRTDPSLYLQNLDLAREAILVLLLEEGAFRTASFLDDRILSTQSQGRWVKFAEMETMLAAANPVRPLHFIFHTGHVGSTLVSRLLDDFGGVLGLREPLPLRVLASAYAERDAPHGLLGATTWRRLLDIQLACWSRGYADTRSVVVKATSSAGQCCQPILEASPTSRALFLNLLPEPYLATLLAGENSYIDVRGQAQERMKRLLQLAPAHAKPLHALSLGEIAAMTWTIETLTHRAAERRYGDRIIRVDFDAFLTDPSITLREICGHFAFDPPEAYFQGVSGNPTLTRYSKAPEHAYTPELRGQILSASRTQNAAEIRKGMVWIDAFARQWPEHAEALSA